MAHHLTTGRFTKFHGHNRDGAFQTGKGEVVHLWLAHEVDQTGVISSRQELVDAGIIAVVNVATNNISIRGVTYTTNALYDQAYIAQRNLDNLLDAFNVFAAPVYIDVSDGIIQTGTANLTPATGTVSTLIGGTDQLGSSLNESAGLVWKVELTFEQKGAFVKVPGLDQGTFVRGAPSVALTANKFGSSTQDIHDLLEGTVMYFGGLLSAGGDEENITDSDGVVAFEAGVNLITGIAGTNTAFNNTIGDEVYIVTNRDAQQATGQTVVVAVQVSGDLQS